MQSIDDRDPVPPHERRGLENEPTVREPELTTLTSSAPVREKGKLNDVRDDALGLVDLEAAEIGEIALRLRHVLFAAALLPVVRTKPGAITRRDLHRDAVVRRIDDEAFGPFTERTPLGGIRERPLREVGEVPRSEQLLSQAHCARSAAARMAAATSFGFEIIATWLEGSSMVVAFIFFAKVRSSGGAIM